MAVSMASKQKAYQGVLEEIRRFIEENDLQTGDKLPSERELADKLKTGRSSVREALRAMELLGLIETRSGEGTYLSQYRPHQTVELLASFILRESNTKKDLISVKSLLEKEAAKLAFDKLAEKHIKALDAILTIDPKNPNEMHFAFFHYLFEKTENLLLAKVWRLMEEFSQTITMLYYDHTFYTELIHLYKRQDFHSIEKLFASFSKPPIT